MRTPNVRGIPFTVFLTIAAVGCQRSEPEAVETASVENVSSDIAWVDAERIINADSQPHNWLVHGRTWSEQRYSQSTARTTVIVDYTALSRRSFNGSRLRVSI